MIKNNLPPNDSKFLSYLRGLSIFVIVFGHVGGFWVFRPYSEFLHVFIPIFFFISGAVCFYSFNRTPTIKIYYLKRFLSFLIPYYLLCILSFFVFIIINRQFPSFDVANILKWIQIRPSDSITPFPIGQIWFLHTLFFITLVSPLFFLLQNKYETILFLLIVVIVIFSGVQLFLDIDNYFYFLGNNLYKPLVHSSFYMFGIVCFSSNQIRKLKYMVTIFIFCIVSSVFLASFLNLNIDYAFHTFAPDLYYVFGSFSAIAAALIFQTYYLDFVQHSRAIENIFAFFHRHTFSIFLLHTFSIYLSEEIAGLVDPPEKTIIYGVIKLVFVLIVTCILAPPFTKLSTTVTALLTRKTTQQGTQPEKTGSRFC